MDQDPELAEKMKSGSFVVSTQSRHSYESAGPRFKRYAGD
jgi:hypothetical protein